MQPRKHLAASLSAALLAFGALATVPAAQAAAAAGFTVPILVIPTNGEAPAIQSPGQRVVTPGVLARAWLDHVAGVPGEGGPDLAELVHSHAPARFEADGTIDIGGSGA